MKTKLLIGFFGGVIAIAAVICQYWESKSAASAAQADVAARENSALRAQLRQVEARAQEAEKRARLADEDNEKLLGAVNGARILPSSHNSAPPPNVVGDSRGKIAQARFSHAKELARSGQYDAALREYLWCLNEGMGSTSGLAAVRSSFLLTAITDLGKAYPPALDALRTQREEARKQMLASPGVSDALQDFVAMNRALGDGQATLAVLDSFALDDPRRQALKSSSYDLLVANQRYADAASVTSYSKMVYQIDRLLQSNNGGPVASDNVLQARHDYLVNLSARDFEVLAGVGDTVNAVAIANKLLAFDSSDATKALLKTRAIRAGQPNILSQVGLR